ncbi:D-alanine--D-alanine ligase family protein [Paenibacillus sacheonensis]|uniref:D-alanine--D-alanine ligase n=1 Tax=Paenibacillus sacheonensis TaxID=742054 RepID=A0A7X4YRZ2_9BACL|nr:D-alanine--D-alanine ligase family protein [Paenibacillus sacheonensis]MBM7566850.1 D-alanine-D-alanine ligase [Paenibacillus sacheonensis]NBC71472.1 D-alanine--D-alanine ligase [Paenibacillus sacheonensis]
MKTKLYVLYGGKSVEHEVSLKTAVTVLLSIDESRFEVYPVYITRDGLWCTPGRLAKEGLTVERLIARPSYRDTASSIGEILSGVMALPGPKVVMPLLHGSNGEDGTVQGLMELLNVPYVGNGVLASALALDKAMSKEILAQAGIRQTDYRVCRFDEWSSDGMAVVRDVEARIGYPCYVKPASLGSSIGISRCTNRGELRAGIQEAFAYDKKLVFEREVAGREIQVAVIGNERPLASLPGEFIHDRAFFDYESKYMDKRLTMSIPAELSAGLTERIRELAVRAYRAHGCEGLARVDFFLDGEGELFLNEINALPGFTNFSMYPVMWERTDGTSYAALIEQLIGHAVARHEDKQTIRYSR